MASVGSTYARAFADVVFSTHLDADGSIAELRSIAGLLAESSELRRVWENPAIPEELDSRLGFAEAQITSARELADAEKRTLEGQIEKVTGKKVRARYEQDASLLGGALVRVGSTIYDGSVKGQLERIRDAISS